MKEEIPIKGTIKEIPIVKFEMDYKESWEKAVSKIYDLQEENERLKEALCKDNIVSKNKYDYLKRQKESLELDLFCIKDYKSRIDKAIEYIKNNWYSKNTRNIDELHSLGDWRLDLLNILQGEDTNVKDKR